MERKDQEHVLSVEGESEADSFYHWRDVLTWTPPIEQPILVAEIRRAESRIGGAPPGDAMFILDIGVISGGQVSVMTGAVKQVLFNKRHPIRGDYVNRVYGRFSVSLIKC